MKLSKAQRLALGVMSVRPIKALECFSVQWHAHEPGIRRATLESLKKLSLCTEKRKTEMPWIHYLYTITPAGLAAIGSAK